MTTANRSLIFKLPVLSYPFLKGAWRNIKFFGNKHTPEYRINLIIYFDYLLNPFVVSTYKSNCKIPLNEQGRRRAPVSALLSGIGG